MPIPAALTSVAPAFADVVEGFDRVLRNGAVPAGSATIEARVTALQSAMALHMPGQESRVMEYVRAAEANLASDVTGVNAALPSIAAQLSPGDDRWRVCLSVAWDLACSAAYGRWV